MRAGVLLALPYVVESGLFRISRKLYGEIGPAFYGLRTTLLACSDGATPHQAARTSQGTGSGRVRQTPWARPRARGEPPHEVHADFRQRSGPRYKTGIGREEARRKNLESEGGGYERMCRHPSINGSVCVAGSRRFLWTG
jgi:hypothetical protein